VVFNEVQRPTLVAGIDEVYQVVNGGHEGSLCLSLAHSCHDDCLISQLQPLTGFDDTTSRGDKTPLELFLAGVRDLEASALALRERTASIGFSNAASILFLASAILPLQSAARF
jgi:hypothetical protein